MVPRTNTDRYRHLKILLSFLFISVLLIVHCAEVGPPPGGEEDRTAPILIGSDPVNGATSVPIDDRVTLYFSESVVKPEGKTAVFVSPRPAAEPKLSWKSDRLVINFADSFNSDQTYIISVSSDITDLRRNRFDASTVVAFSTGATIDSGAISGHVYQEDTAQGGVIVALYDPSQFEDTLPIDSIYPIYINQSNQAGLFSFQYLPQREYRMVAFVDQNRDDRYNPGRESYAVPDRPINLATSLSFEDINLQLARQDTATLRITAANYTPDGLVRMKLSREIDLAYLQDNPRSLLVMSTTDSSAVYESQAILEWDQLAASAVHFLTDSLSDGVYMLRLLHDTTGVPIVFDSMKVAMKQDKQTPMVTFKPDRLPRFVDEIEMRASLSEPLDTGLFSGETFALFDLEGKRLALEHIWLDPLHLKFDSRDLKPGMLYRLQVTEFEIADRAGNVLGDSLTEFVFTTIDTDSLGSISGEIDIRLAGRENTPVVLQFKRVDNRQTFDLPVAARRFNIDLPAGKYQLWGFLDSNGNGRRDPGSVVPYLFSETAATLSDTIAVRARFETAGIVFEFK
ncbi:MAG: Ig-like domain-containing protein [Candidatus Zixiibacteriota bacterium]